MPSSNAQAKTFPDAVDLPERVRILESLIDSVPGMIGYWDRNLICQFANHAYLDWFGNYGEALVGCHMSVALGVDFYANNKVYIAGVLEGVSQRFERPVKKVDGSWGYTLVTYTPDRADNGDVLGFFVLVTDISDLKKTQLELEWSARVVESSLEAIVVTDESGLVLSANPSFCDVFGFSQASMVGTTIDILGAGDTPSLFDTLLDRVAGEGTWRGQVTIRKKDGDAFPAAASVWIILDSNKNNVARVVLMFEDISEQVAKEKELQRQASHDPLTDLPNRVLMQSRLDRMLRHADRNGSTVAVMFIDLNDFKRINDTFGHDAGDTILRHTGALFQSSVRKTDMVARVGGDEFVVLLDNPVNRKSATEIAERILERMRQPVDLCGQMYSPTASIGIVLRSSDGSTSDTLLNRADAAMYEAKRSGKNLFRFAAS